ncbi:MAG TPA: hypothetical protein PLD95_04270 [bacterium]|jgi:hypothetical protein|nr:hypothetical protein [bacterium]HOG38651.1 hypothetical protein [bacterium]HQI03510.1 hypothetical protein [bacterium]
MLHQKATELISRAVTHNDFVGNPTKTNEDMCIIPVANFNFSEITLYTVEMINGKPKITEEEQIVDKQQIDEIIKKCFKI